MGLEINLKNTVYRQVSHKEVPFLKYIKSMFSFYITFLHWIDQIYSSILRQATFFIYGKPSHLYVTCNIPPLYILFEFSPLAMIVPAEISDCT